MIGIRSGEGRRSSADFIVESRTSARYCKFCYSGVRRSAKRVSIHGGEESVCFDVFAHGATTRGAR